MSSGERTSGTIIAGRYVLERQLGVGSFGQVWTAQDSRAFNRPVAVKFLLEQHLTNADVVARFWREGEATAALMHPNVVALLEFGEDAGVPYLVSEFVAGLSLREMLDERKAQGSYLECDEALAIFRQICAGVSAAHAKEIVHRDLKPENVMVQGHGNSVHAKVLDFGIARMLSQNTGSKNTEAGRVMGSLFYMSPEQVLGDSSVVDQRTDVFALGAILFELLTLRAAFEAENFHAVVGRILDGSRPIVTPIRSDLPIAVDTVLQHAFALHPKDRPANVGELLEMTERAIGVPKELSGRMMRPGSVLPPPMVDSHALSPTQTWQADQGHAPSTTDSHEVPAGSSSLPPRSGPSAAMIAAVVALGVVGVAGVVAVLRRPAPAQSPAVVVANAVNAPSVTSVAARETSPVPPRDDPSHWVVIDAPAQAFRLGRATADEGRHGFEPSAAVTFTGPAFRIHVREVTWGNYEAWARTHPSREVHPPAWLPQDPLQRINLPVVSVPWEHAHAYCADLGGDLPSEEQWEYAARGSARRTVPWPGSTAPAGLITFAGTEGLLARVGSVEGDRTPEGVFDLGGNAQEWTASPYRTDDGNAPTWAVALRAIRGLPLRDPPRIDIPPAGLFRNSGCTGAACNAGDLTAIEAVGFRCVRPAI